MIQSIDELLAQCATPLVTPGAKESITVHMNDAPFGIYFSIAFGSRFSIELGLPGRVEGQTIAAQAVPVLFYYDDAPYIDCGSGRPVERVWVYGGIFSGVMVDDRLEGTLEVLYRTGLSNSNPGMIVSSYERLELNLVEVRRL